MNTEIYLDANATSPVMESAMAAAMQAMREGFGNPSSTHATGLRARAMLDGVRAQARKVIGAGEGSVLFTSGATEGIQTAVLSALCAVRDARQRGEATGELLLYGATEHKAVPESLAHWNRLLGTNLQLVKLPVDEHGQHRLDILRELAPRAAMVCTMAANNETGALSDLDGIGAVLRASASRAYWMVDSVQALGKLALDLASSGIDYAPFSGHKLYAPKGTGLLYVRAGAPFTPLMCGGGQESGLRAGTENMAGIAALGAVLDALADDSTFGTHGQLASYRERLAAALRAALPGVVFNCSFDKSLPTTVNFSVPGLASRELLNLFDAAGVRVSSGSACSSAAAAPSYVLEAMGLPAWRCGAAVRLSFGPRASTEFIDEACARIARCGDALRSAPLAREAAVPDQACCDSHALNHAALARLLAEHPDALLVDVREPCEFAVSGPCREGVQNVPLSRLSEHLDEWLRAAGTPLVFFCRSGARSARAVACVQRLGYANAWHVAGGLAMNDAALRRAR